MKASLSDERDDDDDDENSISFHRKLLHLVRSLMKRARLEILEPPTHLPYSVPPIMNLLLGRIGKGNI